MKKTMLFNIKGRHKEKMEDWTELEVTTIGYIKEIQDTLFFIYDEVMGEDDNDISHNRIAIIEDPVKVTINKSGAINSSMIFGDGVNDKSIYETPYGNFVMETETTKIEYSRSTEEILLKINYVLKMNYDFFSESEIIINAKPYNID